MSTPSRSISRGKRLMSTRRRMHDNEKAGIANLVAALVVGDGTEDDLDMDVEAGAVSDVGHTEGDEFAQELALNSQAEAALTARPANAYAAQATPPEPHRMASVSMADIADLEAAFDDGHLPSASPSSDSPSSASGNSIRKPRKLPMAPSVVTSIPRLSRSSRTSRKNRSRARPLPRPSLRSRIMGTLRMPTSTRARMAAGLMAALLVVAVIVATVVGSSGSSGSGSSGPTIKTASVTNTNLFAVALSEGGTDDARNPMGPPVAYSSHSRRSQLDQVQAQEQGEARPVKDLN